MLGFKEEKIELKVVLAIKTLGEFREQKVCHPGLDWPILSFPQDITSLFLSAYLVFQPRGAARAQNRFVPALPELDVYMGVRLFPTCPRPIPLTSHWPHPPNQGPAHLPRCPGVSGPNTMSVARRRDTW